MSSSPEQEQAGFSLDGVKSEPANEDDEDINVE